MASRSRVVEKLLAECGKTTTVVRADIDRKVGEIALEMLSENEGRFAALRRYRNISISTTTKQYLLPSDFFAPSVTFQEVDEDGEFKNICEILTEEEILDRIKDAAAYNYRMCYIEFLQDGASGRGYYLTLATEASADTTFKFVYYREPTEADVDVIKNEALLMQGVRGSLPQYFPETYKVDGAKFMLKVGQFAEKKSRFTTTRIKAVSLMVEKKNRLQRKIGIGL